jgi:gliding motility-associated-like protein
MRVVYKNLKKSFVKFSIALFFCLLPGVKSLFAIVIKVTSNADAGAGTLREAITNSNLSAGVPDIIDFSMLAAGSQTITLLTSLPNISDPAVIDGTTAVNWSLGNPTIEINGNGLVGACLTIDAGGKGSTIKSLVLNRALFTQVYFFQSKLNKVVGCFIGTDKAGLTAQPAVVLGVTKTVNGIFGESADSNTIGGLTPVERNIISGNTQNGIEFTTSNGNKIFGNYIGVDKNGFLPLGNVQKGISIHNNSNANSIGDGSIGGRNIICNNLIMGIHFFSSSSSNLIQGNFIGLNRNNSAGPNKTGIQIEGGSSNFVGGATVNLRNIISSNTNEGIYMVQSSTLNTIQNNFIGVDSSGLLRRTNNNGLIIIGCTNNSLISNVISGNKGQGIMIQDVSTGNTIQSNIIGLGKDGTTAIPDSGVGIYLLNACSLNTIGGNRAQRNIICSNISEGIKIENSSNNNTITGNFIGVDANNNAKGNIQNGIYCINSCLNTIIGGAGSLRNVISNNIGMGIKLEVSSNSTSILGNYIGVDSTGLNAMGNQHGVWVLGSNGTTVQNAVISGNKDAGIRVENSSRNTVITGNIIGLGVDGTTAIGNKGNGMYFFSKCSNNKIGGLALAQRNIISANINIGIFLENGCDTNSIINNYIGLDISGNNNRGNGSGIQLNGINLTQIQNCVISGNKRPGIDLAFDGAKIGTNNTTIVGNIIGLTADKSTVVSNGGNGIQNTNVKNTIIGGPNKGDGNFISGNGYDAGAALTLGNRASGISMTGSNNIQVLNNVIGFAINTTTKDTIVAAGNSDYGIWDNRSTNLTFTGNVIGNNGQGTLSIGGLGSGINITGPVTAATIKGNTIGLDVKGNPAGNYNYGIFLNDTASNVAIGGTAITDGNIISGNLKSGICLNKASTNTIYGNYIGTDKAGVAKGNKENGILISNSSSGNIIGGFAANMPNQIANNSFNGINIPDAASNNNSIHQNSIYCNTLRGIELNGLGNNNYPAPKIDFTNTTASKVLGKASPNAYVEIFTLGAAPCKSCTAGSNQIQGRVYKGTVQALADSTWSFTPGVALTGETVVTTASSTASGAGNTSEFSVCSSGCVPPSFTVDLPNKIQFCANNNSIAKLVVKASGSPTYIWMVDTGSGFKNIVNNATFTIKNDSLLIKTSMAVNGYRFRVDAVGTNPCHTLSNTDTLKIDTLSVTGVISGTNLICNNTSTTLNLTASQTGTFQWQQSSAAAGPFANVSGGAGATTKVYTTALLNAPTFFQVAVTRGTCSANSSAIKVDITNAPTFVITPVDNTICVNTKGQFVGKISGATGGYKWLVDKGAGMVAVTNEGVITGAQSDTLTIVNALSSLNGYKFQYTATSPNAGCPVPAKIAVLTVESPSVGSILLPPTPAVYCKGQTATLTLTPAQKNIQWYQSSNGSSFSLINGANASPYTTGSLTDTTYFKASFTNGVCAAVTSAPVKVVVSKQPTGNASNTGGVCYNAADTIRLSNVIGSIQWQAFDTLKNPTWNNLAGAQAAVYITPPLTVKAMYRAVLTTNGCPSINSNSVVSTIKINPAFRATGHDTTVCEGAKYTLKAPDGFSNYFWQNTAATQTINLSQTGTFWVTAKAGNNCTVSDTVKVKACDVAIKIPDVFTPGSDGFNDVFYIIGNPNNSSIEIFNRWGELLYSRPNYQNNWDGAGASDGVYYYIYKPGNGKPPYRGYVSIFNEKK